MAVTLGYWDIRGLAQPIRLLLEYTGTPYEEKAYVCGEAPNYDKSCWFNVKEKMSLDFPNLPYLIDGEHRITQSNAIMRYLGRRHNMCGETEEERVRVDMIDHQSVDFRFAFIVLCYSPEHEKKKAEFLKNLHTTLERFSKFLGNRKWFAGDKITFADFLMYEILDQHRLFEPTCLDSFKNLKDFLDRFEKLDKIAQFMKSTRYYKGPINNRMALWGNKKM